MELRDVFLFLGSSIAMHERRRFEFNCRIWVHAFQRYTVYYYGSSISQRMILFRLVSLALQCIYTWWQNAILRVLSAQVILALIIFMVAVVNMISLVTLP